MDRPEASTLNDLAKTFFDQSAASAGDDTPRQPGRPTQLRLIDATVAGQDAMTLTKVAKLIAGMSTEGRRATICWLVAYFDYFSDSE